MFNGRIRKHQAKRPIGERNPPSIPLNTGDRVPPFGRHCWIDDRNDTPCSRPEAEGPTHAQEFGIEVAGNLRSNPAMRFRRRARERWSPIPKIASITNPRPRRSPCTRNGFASRYAQSTQLACHLAFACSCSAGRPAATQPPRVASPGWNSGRGRWPHRKQRR